MWETSTKRDFELKADGYFALPSLNHMCDKTIGVAVGGQLGLNVWEALTCSCGATVSARATNGLSCKRIARLMILFGEPSNALMIRPSKKPTGLLREGGKCPNYLILVIWQNSGCLGWDATMMVILLRHPIFCQLPRFWFGYRSSDRTEKIEVCRYLSYIFDPVARTGQRRRSSAIYQINDGLSGRKIFIIITILFSFWQAKQNKSNNINHIYIYSSGIPMPRKSSTTCVRQCAMVRTWNRSQRWL